MSSDSEIPLEVNTTFTLFSIKTLIAFYAVNKHLDWKILQVVHNRESF